MCVQLSRRGENIFWKIKMAGKSAAALHRIKEKEIFMFQITPRLNFMKLFMDNRPRAFAQLLGNESYPDLQGYVYFYGVPNGGLLIEAEVFGLPVSGSLDIPDFYGFHLHKTGDCSGDFSGADGHYNPNGQPHPHHAGDMPPLRSSDGYAWLAFYDSRLELYDVVGRSVIIHKDEDDFTSQPSGNAGEMIACGVIRQV